MLFLHLILKRAIRLKQPSTSCERHCGIVMCLRQAGPNRSVHWAWAAPPSRRRRGHEKQLKACSHRDTSTLCQTAIRDRQGRRQRETAMPGGAGASGLKPESCTGSGPGRAEARRAWGCMLLDRHNSAALAGAWRGGWVTCAPLGPVPPPRLDSDV